MLKSFIKLHLLVTCITLSAAISAQPAIEWDKTFGGSKDEQFPIITLTSDGGYIAGGTSASGISGEKSEAGRGGLDYWIIKFSKNGTKQWDKTFGGDQDDQLTSIVQASDGGYLLAGSSSSGISGDKTDIVRAETDYWVVKTDAGGNKEWDKTFGASEPSYLTSANQTFDGGFIVGGNSSGFPGAEKSEVSAWTDYWILKMDKNGVKVWDKTIYAGYIDSLVYVNETADHGFILAGTVSLNYFNVLKLDSARNIVWKKTFISAYSYMRSCQTTSDGGCIIGGTSNAWSGTDKSEVPKGNQTNFDYWVVKLAADGKVEWDRTIGGTGDDNLISIQSTPRGNFILGGTSTSGPGYDKSEGTGKSLWTVKLSSSGKKIWDKSIQATAANDNFSSLIYTPDGGILVAGATPGGIGGNKTQKTRGGSDFWIVKLAADEEPRPFWASGQTLLVGDREVALEWSTHLELGTDRFEVQHSIDKKSWEKLASVKAQDTSYVESRYRFVHPNLDYGKHYYRLRFVPNNGTANVGRTDSAQFIKLFTPFEVEWDRTFGGAGSDVLRKVVQTSDGGYILGGASDEESGETGDRTQSTRGYKDCWLVKVSPDGTKEWDKSLGGNYQDYVVDIEQTREGGYIVASSSYSSAGFDKSENDGGSSNPEDPQPDFWIIKMAADGTKEWDRTLAKRGEEYVEGVRQTNDGGYLAWGTPYTVKLSADGTKEWDLDGTIGIAIDKSGKVQTRDGGYVVSNYAKCGYNVTKLSATGVPVWEKTFSGNSNDTYQGGFSPITMRMTSDGGYIFGSETTCGAGNDKSEASRGLVDIWIIKTDAAGKLVWEKTLGGSSNEYLKSITELSDGSFMISASTSSSANGDVTGAINGGQDAWFVKLSADGVKVWDQTLGGSEYRDYLGNRYGSTNLQFVEELADGYLVSGSSSGKASDDKASDAAGHWTVKLAKNGDKVWETSFAGPPGLQKTRDGGYISLTSSAANAGGEKSEDSRGQEDYWILKIRPIDGEDPLPVNLLSFSATKENNVAILTWQTTSETRSSHFEIQHSLNGKSWNRIGSVNALGENTGLHDYQAVHPDPANGNNYYRLKMVDTDGAFTYSKVERLSFQLDFEVNVYPNPAAEIIHLKAADWTKVKSVEILNAQGKTVYLSGKKPVQHLNDGALGTGLYFVKIIDVNGSETVRKIVVGR